MAKTHSKGSPPSGLSSPETIESFAEMGDDLPTEEDLNEMEKSTVVVDMDKPVVMVPFVWTASASRRQMFMNIATLEKTYRNHGGIGAVLLEQAINIAMGLAIYSNPAPNQKLVVTIGISPEIHGEANVFVKCEQKAVRLPPGFDSIRDLEIFEAKQKEDETPAA